MEWKKCYLDLILVPLALVSGVVYHSLLWYKIRNSPLQTTVGVNFIGRRLWIQSIIKDNEKKNILAVQSLRNSLMGSSLMATTSVFLSSGLAAMISTTYSVKQPLHHTSYTAHQELKVALKYVTLLMFFLFSFFCHSLAIRFLTQVNYLVNTIQFQSTVITAEYVCELFEKGFLFNAIGNRIFFMALPLLLWVFGPVLPFVCSIALVPVLYSLDYIVIAQNNVLDQVENHRQESREINMV